MRGLIAVLASILVLSLGLFVAVYAAARQARQDYGENNAFHDFYKGRDTDLAQQRLEEMRKKRKARLVVIKCLPLGYVIYPRPADPSKGDRTFQKICFTDWEWAGPIVYGIVRPIAGIRVAIIGDDAMPEKQPFQKEQSLHGLRVHNPRASFNHDGFPFSVNIGNLFCADSRGQSTPAVFYWL